MKKILALLLCTVLLAASSLLPALAEDAPLLGAWAPYADTPTDIPREEASEMFHCANSAQNSAFRGLWIIWVAAGVIFPAVVAMTNAFEKKSKENFRQYRTNELVRYCLYNKNVFRRLWATHSLFVGRTFYGNLAILFFGGT